MAACNTSGTAPVCDLACATGYHKCGAACVADNDPKNCGTKCEPCNVTLPVNAPAQACEATPPSTTLACTFTCAVGPDAASSFHRCGSACVVNSKYCPNAADPCTPCSGSQVCNAGGTACVNPPPS
jgi:hypothetical protein